MGSLFSPKVPKPEKPIPMPDEQALMKQKRRNMQQKLASGRSSTILTDTLG